MFFGGLSLHLNHLIQSWVGISYWLFGTLPIGLLLSNLDSRQLETSPMISYDQFWIMSTFCYSRAIWVLWATNISVQKIIFFSMKERQGLRVLGGQVPRLYGGTIFGGLGHTWGRWAQSLALISGERGRASVLAGGRGTPVLAGGVGGYPVSAGVPLPYQQDLG